jgi:hypothetical protein
LLSLRILREALELQRTGNGELRTDGPPDFLQNLRGSL